MYLLRRRPLLIFALCFGAGVITAYLTDVPALVMLISAAVLGIAACISLLFSGRRRIFLSAALVLFYLAVSCAGCSYTSARIAARPEFENTYDAIFSGTVSGDPYTDNGGERYICELTDITVNAVPTDCTLRLYLRGDAESLKGIGCGMKISGKGHVYSPDHASNPHEFDFAEYLWREGMAAYVTAYLENVEITGETGGYDAFMYSIRSAIGSRIDSAFPNSKQLVRALILGDKRDMDDDIREDFAIAGVAHLLAISGLHITLIAMFVSFLFKKLIGVWPATIITLIAVFAYGLLIGFSPSISRAAIMYAALCGAPLFGRPAEGTTRLALAFLVILLINPINIADPGFVMSFCASAGLIWLSGPMMRLMRLYKFTSGFSIGKQILRYLASLLTATLSAQLATYPALALYYGTFSVVSVISNLFLVPLCLVSLVAAYIGLVIPAVAFIPDMMLHLLRQAVGICAGVSWAVVPVPAPPFWLWLGLFTVGMLASEVSHFPKKFKPYLVILVPVFIIAAILIPMNPGMQVVFLDVEQADSAVIRTGDKAYVVDLGEEGGITANYINGENLSVEALFLSHHHSDHAGGLGEFAAACDIGMIYIPEGWDDEMEGEEMRAEWAAVIASGVPYRVLSGGDEIRLTDDAIITIHDCAADTGDAGNDMSLIMLLDYGACEVLFTGDANAGNAPDADILKVGHHGARNATDETVVNSITPEVAVISVGRNHYGHPSGEVIELLKGCGAEIYRTDECGAITIALDKDGDYRITTFREDPR